MNTFFGINVATGGLIAGQSAMNTISHNISNTNTDGYSRQVIVQQAASPYKTYNKAGMIGGGVDVSAVIRIRNSFLDQRYQQENSVYCECKTKSEILSELESILNAGSDTDSDIFTVWEEFCSSLEDLSNNADGDETRATVVEYGKSLCEYINNMANSLLDEQEDINSSVKIRVEEINSYAEQIADLNQQIHKAEINGSNANDLRDQRTLLVDKLSALVGVEAKEVVVGTLPDGSKDTRFVVLLDGEYLVNDSDVNQLDCYVIEDGSDRDGLYGIKWDNTGEEVEIDSGELGAYLELRDGSGEDGEYKGIPYYIDKLNEFARTVAKAFNEGILSYGEKYCDGHAGGCGTDGSTGVRFFTYNGISSDEFIASGSDVDSRYANITAFNISVSSDIEEDSDKIAAASSNGESGNNENVAELINLLSDSSVFVEGSPEEFLISMVTVLGIDTNQASDYSDKHETFLNHLDTSRISISGVSEDEETANLVKYQQAYSAAANVITVLDEMLTKIIEDMGA